MTIIDPSSLCSSISRVLSSVSYQLQQLEERNATPHSTSRRNDIGLTSRSDDEARAGLTKDLNAVFQELAKLDRAIADGLGGQRNDYYSKKASSLHKDALIVRSNVERFLSGAYAVRREREQREQLFGSASESVAIDAFISEKKSLGSSLGMLDELQQAGEGIITSLRQQRGLLKGVHRKALDMTSTLGMSNTLMRMIERRTTGDKILVFGGLGILFLLLGLVIWVFR